MNVFTPCRMTDYQVMPELSSDDVAAVGHNSTRELDLIAGDARHGLELVSAGEGQAIDGWLVYGAALNAGRKKFPSDEQFGQWLVSSNLEETLHPADQSAAMWAARDSARFSEAQKLRRSAMLAQCAAFTPNGTKSSTGSQQRKPNGKPKKQRRPLRLPKRKRRRQRRKLRLRKMRPREWRPR